MWTFIHATISGAGVTLSKMENSRLPIEEASYSLEAFFCGLHFTRKNIVSMIEQTIATLLYPDWLLFASCQFADVFR